MTKISMSKTERLDKIAADVLRKGEVTLDQLADALGVSKMTIHRDLEELETRGVLRKIRNGATAQPSSVFESNVAFRMSRAAAQKERLAFAAAALVEPGDVVLLDDATTILPMIPLLAAIGDVTVVSNFLPALAMISKLPQLHLIALGGEYLQQFDTFTGAICEQAVHQLRVNRYFTSTTAIDGAAGYHPHPQVASVKRAMMNASVHRFLLADTSKFFRTALHRFADLEEFDGILIDQDLPRERLGTLEQLREKITVVPAEQPSTDHTTKEQAL